MSAPKWLDVREVRRWLTLRCAHCGHRFLWKRDPRNSFGNADRKVYHSPCIAYISWRTKADERLDTLALACDLAGLRERDVITAAELRTDTEQDRMEAYNKAWRVMHDLGLRAIANTPASRGDEGG